MLNFAQFHCNSIYLCKNNANDCTSCFIFKSERTVDALLFDVMLLDTLPYSVKFQIPVNKKHS